MFLVGLSAWQILTLEMFADPALVSLPALDQVMGSKFSGSSQGAAFVQLVFSFPFVIKGGKHKVVENSLHPTFSKSFI